MIAGERDPVRRPYRMVARADQVQANVDRVLDEAVVLFTENPYDDVSLDLVADGAGVTKRTVLRRFGSKEALFVAAMSRAAAEMMRQRDTAPVGDVAAGVRTIMDHYERWGVNRLRMLEQEGRIPVVAEHVAGGRAYHRQWVERTFAPLLHGSRGAARMRRLAALIAATDVYTWKLLRRDLGLSRADTERVVADLVGHVERRP